MKKKPEQVSRSEQDEALFAALRKRKKRRRRKIIITVIVIVLIAAIAIAVGTIVLRRKVTEQFAASKNDVTSAEATIGSISTTVSGSGRLTNADEESVTVPANVTVDEILVSRNSTVSEGDVIATVNLSSVMDAMSSVQEDIDELDEEIADAADDAVSTKVTAGVAGRVKIIYAAADDNVVTCMYQNGALAVLSADGYMAVDLETDQLTAGDAVTVTLPDETELSGTVDSAERGTAVVLISDEKAMPDDVVTVSTADGEPVGSGTLYIHNPLRVTGITGTVSKVNTELNKKVSEGTLLFTLKDTSYSADYESLLQQRSELEANLLELMQLYRDGAVLAPFDGTVSSVDMSENTTTTAETSVITQNPGKTMTISISVDESDILSLEVGQTASVTISSIGDNVYVGTVTDIDETATSSSGVTRYTAEITVDRDPQMLAGMTASVSIRISGVDNAVLIPVEALHQTSSTSYVYTTYDEDTMEFGGKTEVTTGLSNSTYVEITSGLNEGDTVWYTPEAETFDFSAFGGFGGDTSGFSGSFGDGDSSGFPSSFGNGDSTGFPSSFGDGDSTGFPSGFGGGDTSGFPGGFSGGPTGG